MLVWLLVLIGVDAADHWRTSRIPLTSELEIGAVTLKRRSSTSNLTGYASDSEADALHLRQRRLEPYTGGQRLRGTTQGFASAPETSVATNVSQQKEHAQPVLGDEQQTKTVVAEEQQTKTVVADEHQRKVSPKKPHKEDTSSTRMKIPIKSAQGIDLVTIDAVMHAIQVSYVVTFGTYYKLSLDELTIAKKIMLKRRLPTNENGWLRHPTLDSNPAEGVNGVHGIVFTNAFQQAIIAIRGTDLPRKPEECVARSGCRADLCADKRLWDIPEKVIDTSELPAWCQNSSAVHDYPADATRFVKGVLSALPDHDILLVGHSLGAGLALLAGAQIIQEGALPDRVSMQVVAVSPPPYALLLGKQQLDDRFLVIYNTLDPLLYATMDRGGFQGATPMCYTMEDQKDTVISSCTESCIPSVNKRDKPDVFGTVWPARMCDGCYPRTHTLKPYLVSSTGKRPLVRCQAMIPNKETIPHRVQEIDIKLLFGED
jgi:hypothetical protein